MTSPRILPNKLLSSLSDVLYTPLSPRRATFGLLGALFCLLSWTASANEGAFLLGNDALQLGRAGSGIASPRSAYWSYLNPASMVDLEKRLDINLYSVFTDIGMEPSGLIGNGLDGYLHSRDIFNIISGGIIWPLETGVLGGGLYIPSGTGADYERSRNLISRFFQGNSDRKLMCQHARLVLAYGYEFDNGWALGVGLHASVSRFKSDHLTLSLRPTEGDFDWDEALGAGFNIGVYKHWDKWSFGATYTSRHWTQAYDEYEDLLKYTMDMPHIVQAGVAYKVTPKLELTADIKYLWWSEVKQFGAEVLDGGFGWTNQVGIKLGIEYKVSDRWTLMGGFAHGNTPIDEEHAFIAGLVPVTVEDHITAGVTYAFDEHSEVHFVAIYGVPNTVTDSGGGDLFSKLGKGTEVMCNGTSFVLGYTYKF